jgi:hypothetical protein
MIERAPASSQATEVDRHAFLGSHRAISVGAREFTRLSEALVAAAKQLAPAHGAEPPVSRLSPDRCIVQVGPVALTVLYIRNGTDVPAGGQLLAMVWRGTIAARGDHVPERMPARRVTPQPVAVWEETHVVSADNEASWHWHPKSLHESGYTSPELADRCMEHLRTALVESSPVVA